MLRMEFKTFLNAFVKIPCQIVRAGRQLIYRVLNYNPQLPVFFRLVPGVALLTEPPLKPESGCSGPPPPLTARSATRLDMTQPKFRRHPPTPPPSGRSCTHLSTTKIQRQLSIGVRLFKG